MVRHSLPIFALKTDDQRYSCHSCGLCCRDFTVQLRDTDIEKLERHGWYEKLGETPYVEFRGRTFLRQREDGSCVFLQEDGLCRIHAEHGLAEKPIACQLFPFTFMPAKGGAQLGMSFACPSAINSRGSALSSHLPDLRRLVRFVPEVKPTDRPLRLKDAIELSDGDARAVAKSIDDWMTRDDLSIEMRLDGLALLTSVLREEPLESIVTGGKLPTLLSRLFDAAPDDIEEAPPAAPTKRQRRQLRQVVFAHIEDPKIPGLRGRFAIQRRAWRQLFINRRFSRGRGEFPIRVGHGWPESMQFENVEGVAPMANDDDVAWVDSLMTRYVRARVLGGRAYGPGYYGFSVIDGLDAMWLMLAATGWLARLHASGEERGTLTPADIESALIRTDRAAGRAPWLGSRAERLRLRYLSRDQGVRRLRQAWRLTDG